MTPCYPVFVPRLPQAVIHRFASLHPVARAGRPVGHAHGQTAHPAGAHAAHAAPHPVSTAYHCVRLPGALPATPGGLPVASAAVAPATALGKVISSGLLAASIGFGAAGLGAAGLGLAGLGAAGTGAALGDTGTTQLAMASAPVGTGFLMPGGPALTQIDLPSTGSTIPPTGAGPGATVPAGVAPLDDTAPVPLDEPASTLTLLAGIATTLLFRRRRATGLARR